MSKVFGRSANIQHTRATQTPSPSVCLSLCIISFSSFHVTERETGERERERSCKVSPATCGARCARALNLFKAPRVMADFLDHFVSENEKKQLICYMKCKQITSSQLFETTYIYRVDLTKGQPSLPQNGHALYRPSPSA